MQTPRTQKSISRRTRVLPSIPLGKLLASLFVLLASHAFAAVGTVDFVGGNPLSNVPYDVGQIYTYAPPSLASATPNTGAQGATLNVAIVGTNTNFVNGTSVASFSGTGITVNTTTVTDATHATANITISGAAATTARDVTVTTTAEVATLTSGFTVTAGTPTITSLSPITGSIAGGTAVVITGTNLTTATSVSFGGTPATPTSTTATSILVTAPAHAAGSVSVTVTTAGGPATGSLSYNYVEIPTTFSGGALTIDGSGSSGPAHLKFIVDGSGYLVIQDTSVPPRSLGSGIGITPVDSSTIKILLSSITSLNITGTPFADSFNLDFSNDLPANINVDGGSPTTSPGDVMAINNTPFGEDGFYGPSGTGAGTISLTGGSGTNTIVFTGLEPVDLSGAPLHNFTVTIDPTNVLTTNITTTVASADAGVNTLITFDHGLESVKLGTVTGTLTINGSDNTTGGANDITKGNDYFVLQGLGSAMAADFVVDGKGGGADVIDINNTTFTVPGSGKNLSLKADFIGIGRLDVAPGTDQPGVINCSGDITLEANGDSSVVVPIWDVAGSPVTPGVWGTLPTYFMGGSTVANLFRGTIQVRGDILKTAGADSTLTLKAAGSVTFPSDPSFVTFLTGRVISTNNKLNVVVQTDTDSLNGGSILLNHHATITTNGGDLTMGGGANALTSPAVGTLDITTTATGIVLQSSNISTSGGNISLRGRGANRASGGGVSVNVFNGSVDNVLDSGSGNITINGTSGTGAFSTLVGTLIAGNTSNATHVKSSTGAITITGTSATTTIFGASLVSGFQMQQNCDIKASGAGNISITGSTPASPTATVADINITNTALATTVAISSVGGNVTFVGDSMNLAGGTQLKSYSTSGSGLFTLKQRTNGKNIDLGAADSASLLAFSTTELGTITSPTLQIGDSNSGTINVSAALASTTYTTLALANNTTFAATGGFTSTVSSASSYNKMTVTGTVSITAGAALTLTPSAYTWNGTDNFTILTNDGSDAISGTFTGPTLTNFLGSALTAQQSYTGGTGNDLVFGAAPTVNTNTSAYLLSATTLIINGTGFDGVTPGNNIVTLSGGVTGVVTSATSTQLTVTLTGPVLGPLTATVTNGLSSSPTQVATFINTPVLNINDVTHNEGNSGTTTYTFTVSLDVPAAFGGVTFDIATADNTATTADGDYVAKSTIGATIPAGSSSATFDVTVNGDTTFEPNETFAVNVTNVVGANVNDGSALGTITNDDAAPTLSINSTSIAEGNSGTTTLGFTVSLSSASSQTITVLATTADGSATLADNDYAANSQLITFAPGTTSMPFNVTVNGDTKVETDETMYVHLTCPVNSAINALGGGIGIGTITNDDGGTGHVYVVTTNVDSDPAGWSALDTTNGKINGGNTVSLRSAVLAANQSGAGPHLIMVPGNIGTYTLSQFNPTNAALYKTNGGADLVVGDDGSTIVIQGFNGTPDILQAATYVDVITTGLKADGISPNIVNLSLDNLKIRGGAYTGIFVGADDGAGHVSSTQITNCDIRNNDNADGTYGQGGAIQDTGGFLTISDTIFDSNTATNTATGQGGAIYFNLPNASGQGSVGAISILNCSFNANSASLASGLAGGAVYVNINSSGANTVIKGCTFTSNVVLGGDGAAIAIYGARTSDITNNNFQGNFVNNAGGHGGAIAIGTGATNINYNRFSANTVITAANGAAIYRAPAATGTVNANNNWWKANAGPAVNDIVGTITNTSNINLKLVATPTSVPLLGTSNLVADFFTTSTATSLSLAQVSALIGLPVSYGSATFGSLTGSDTSLQCDGRALSTFTGGAVSGTGGASVLIDGQTVSATIIVGSDPTDSKLLSLSASAGALSPAFAPATISYAVSTASATTTTTITPTANASGAQLLYNVNGGISSPIASGATSAAIPLNAVGVPTPIVVHVISPDSSTTTDYTVTVTRVASGGPPITVLTSTTDTPPGVAGATWGSIRSGMTLASSGALAFRAHLTIAGAVTANDFQGIWKSTDGSIGATSLVARSGITSVPGVSGALFDILPLNPIINNAALTSFVGYLRVGTGGVTASNDSGVWTELGTGGLKLVLREGDTLGGNTMDTISPSGWVSGGTSAVAFSVRLAPTGTAMVRATVAGATVTPVIVATQGVAAPVISGGTAGNFDNLGGNFSDPRMDSAGDIAFSAGLSTGGVGIWYSPIAGGLNAVANDGEAAPGLGGPTFTSFERPSLSADGSTIAFRAFVTGANGQAIYKGSPTAPASLTAIAKSNDTVATIPGIPAGSKLWSLWSPFTNNTGKVAFRVSMLDGSSVETRAIVTDADGTLKVIAKVGDVAPGFGAETFTNFDHPIIGDGNQAAFIASTSGGNVGLFRQAAGGGALALVAKVGDVITVTGGGTETINSMIVPGGGSDDRKYETKAIDAAGHILVHATYNSGKTGIVLSAP